GKSAYPFSLMHAANFTALSRPVAFLSLVVLLLLAVSVVLAAPLLWVPPQPALITTTMATMARAGRGRSVFLMGSPLLFWLRGDRALPNVRFRAEFLVPWLVAVDPA